MGLGGSVYKYIFVPYLTLSFLDVRSTYIVYRSSCALFDRGPEKLWRLLAHTYSHFFSTRYPSVQLLIIPHITHTTVPVSNMRVLFDLAAMAVFALGSLAQSMPNSFDIPPGGYLLKAGQPTTFKWSNLAGSTVTLTLRDGSNGALNPGTVIQGMLLSSAIYHSQCPLSFLVSLEPPSVTLLLYEAQQLDPLSLPLTNPLQPTSPTQALTPTHPPPTSSKATPTPSKSPTTRTLPR